MNTKKRIGSLLDQMTLGGMEDNSAQNAFDLFRKDRKPNDLSAYKAAPWAAALGDLMANERSRILQRRAEEEKKRNKENMFNYAKRREEQDRREAEEDRAEKMRKEARDQSWKEREFALKEADQRSRERHRATMEGIAQKRSIYDQDKRENRNYEKMADKISDPQERLRFLSNPRKYAPDIRTKKPGLVRGVLQDVGLAKGGNEYVLRRPGNTPNNINKAASRKRKEEEARRLARGY
jgi:hypothetical protein